MMKNATRRWRILAGIMTGVLAISAVPYFRWAIFVVTEPSNPLWPDRQAMFWDGIGFGLLVLILKLWWITATVAVIVVVVWVRAFRRTEDSEVNQASLPIAGKPDSG